MRRPYTLDYYRRLVDGIVERLPHASIGSDMIVGFPGETDEDFDANLDYLPASPLSHLHVFPYSDRPGTEARAMGDKVDGADDPRARRRRCAQIGAELSRAFASRRSGTVRPGLTLEDGTLVVTDNYLKVRIPPGLQAKTNRAGARAWRSDRMKSAGDDLSSVDACARPDPATCSGAHQHRQPRARRFPSRRLRDQLTAGGANVAAADLRTDTVTPRSARISREPVDAHRRTAGRTESRPPR